MKLIMLIALLMGLWTPLYGQQQWCFSKNCPETPAPSFTLDRSNKLLDNLFRSSPALPAYKPLAPLTFSPSTRQFFLDSMPAVNGLKFPNLSIPSKSFTDSGEGNAGTRALSSGVNGSHGTNPEFSTGKGGMSFTPASPKF